MAKLRSAYEKTLIALVLGVAVGIVFMLFEWIVKDGTDFIWNDVFNTDEVRWLVVPLAIILGVAFGWTLKQTGQEQLPKIHTNFAEAEPPKKIDMKDIGIVFLVGAVSLLAGASLGPEASLVSLSSGLGMWVASKAGLDEQRQLMMLAGVGALLVAFFGSLLLAVVPVLLLKQAGKLNRKTILPPLAAALGTYLIIAFLSGDVKGWGGIPLSPHFKFKDLLLAFLLGLLASIAVAWLNKQVFKFRDYAETIYKKYTWWKASAIFGGVIGLLYWIGGQSVQFNGSAGTVMLVKHSAEYGTLALAGLVVIKLLVTAWSLAAGYRGGLVFPSIYTGVALSLFIGSLASGLGGPGTTIGAVAGIITALTTPALGAIMLISLMPLKLLIVGLAGAAGAVAGSRLIAGAAKPRGALKG
jgi:H+/Cl- antiporter ClcA